MVLLKFISLSVGSLMLLQGTYAANSLSVEADCVKTMNAARKEVGLPEFGSVETTKQLFGETNKAKSLVSFCKALQTDNEASSGGLTEAVNGTVAYAVQTSKDCAAAVKKWKDGFSLFSSNTSTPPPAYKKKASPTATDQTGEAPYDSVDAVNFVALYNGQNSPTAECAYFTCTNSSQEAVNAMVCVTYPPALVNEQPPFNETQWKGILNVFAPSSSSASAAVPTLLALAAAAVGVALM